MKRAYKTFINQENDLLRTPCDQMNKKYRHMKTKLLISGLLITLFISHSAFSQESDTDYSMAVLVFMDVKVGSENAFEKATIEHNEKFHNEIPNLGSLDQIMSGSQAGTYVWIKGPCTFTDIGNLDLGDDHDNHWDKEVAPYIQSYGAQEYWKMNDKLSYAKIPDAERKFSNIWLLDINRGDYYRFEAIMTKIVEAYDKKGSGTMRMYENQFGGAEGRDVAIVWDIKNMAELDIDDGGIKGAYEEINGEDSWNTMLDEWEAVTVSVNRMLWRVNISK